MKIRLAIILSMLLMFSSLQEGMSQLSSAMFSGNSCCATTIEVEADDSCDIEDDSVKVTDSCCEGSTCDCTCCIHVSLFSTLMSDLTIVSEAVGEKYQYHFSPIQTLPQGVFHPPLFLA